MSELDAGSLMTDYFLGDALGSARQLTDANGNLTLSKAYDPYGVVTSRCDPYNENDCRYDAEWVHSLRGDWNEKYWDKTANQACHFWGILAITFFDGAAMGNLANEVHEKGWQNQGYDFIGTDPGQAPPYHGVSKPDYDLSIRSIELGSRLRHEHRIQSLFYSCDPRLKAIWDDFGTNIGEWIRNNLKE